MTIQSIGFIGCGRIARILLGGFKAAGITLPNVIGSDLNPENIDKLRAAFPQIQSAGSDNAKPAAQQVVLLAVHPPAIGSVLSDIKAALRRDAILVSLAPKFTMAKLSELLGGFNRLARMIPNAPSIIGAGYNPMAFGPGLSSAEKQALAAFFAPLGECPEVAESKLEGFALLTGMGPTYLWFQLETLRGLAKDFGLSETDITPALKRTVCGATRTLLESGLSPAEVMDLIPVKPLAEDEAAIKQAYQTRLPALFAKIKP
ncbi:MAG: pyrroline-5-carboxylate reductase family protein [Verrucomicrobiia bacterium]